MLAKARETEKMNGFTLIEILIAMSILTVGILGVAAMQIAAIQGNSTASNVTEGINSGSGKIEDLLERGLQNYSASDLTDTNADGFAGLNNATAVTADRSAIYGKYTVYWNVAADEFIPRTKTINIVITWTDRGILKSTALRSVVPEYL